jgi:hypothetical protein
MGPKQGEECSGDGPACCGDDLLCHFVPDNQNPGSSLKCNPCVEAGNPCGESTICCGQLGCHGDGQGGAPTCQ